MREDEPQFEFKLRNNEHTSRRPQHHQLASVVTVEFSVNSWGRLRVRRRQRGRGRRFGDDRRELDGEEEQAVWKSACEIA